MLNGESDRFYPSAKTLIADKVASRISAKDASLYDFSEEARTCAENYMGWTDLAANPPIDLQELRAFADRMFDQGMETVVLIGQGGSTQAPMTLTKYNKVDSSMITFKTLDSDSPVRLRSIMSDATPETTLVIHASKSGGTLEPRCAMKVVRDILEEHLPTAEVPKHLVAITDPGSDLEKQAREEGWAKVFLGEPTVGGRFSALSVFGLLPAALTGINLKDLMEHASRAEELCSADDLDNPAIGLASFLYDNYREGRNKFAFLTPKRGRVLGLWIEQLVAESLGKNGQGILPNIEVDPLLLNEDPGDRSVITYQTKTDLWDERNNFEMSLSYLDQAIPRLRFKIDNVSELAEHFVLWEYAIAMTGYLMKVCPFDQPDVASAKAEVLNILENGYPEPDFVENGIGRIDVGCVEVRTSEQFKGATSVHDALEQLFRSVQPGDYFATNAFLPFTGEGRREAAELMRHAVAEHLGCVSCLEIGPRYLHSTGQLQKGGDNNGVFLILSANEVKDIEIDDDLVPSMGVLAKAQASGDLVTLNSRGRRCVHLHLPDNTGVTLRALSNEVQSILRSL